MKLHLSKQPEKYLASVPENIRNRLYEALNEVAQMKGDIRKLSGSSGYYRYKIYKYRILFVVDLDAQSITVTEINTRTNIKY